jgi:hypothetical protein
MVLALLAVCRNNMRGIYFLLKEDHAEQARIVARTLLVDCMRLLYFHRNEQRLETMRIAFELGSIHQERQFIKEVAKYTDEGVAESLALLQEQEEELRQQADEIGVQPDELRREVAILANAQQLFDAMPQPEGYVFFRYASHAAHTSRIALEAQKQYGEDGTVQLQFGGTPGNVLRVGVQSAQLFLFGYRAAAEMLGWDTIDAIRSFFDHANDRLMRLREDADLGEFQHILTGADAHAAEKETMESDPA